MKLFFLSTSVQVFKRVKVEERKVLTLEPENSVGPYSLVHFTLVSPKLMLTDVVDDQRVARQRVMPVFNCKDKRLLRSLPPFPLFALRFSKVKLTICDFESAHVISPGQLKFSEIPGQVVALCVIILWRFQSDPLSHLGIYELFGSWRRVREG